MGARVVWDHEGVGSTPTGSTLTNWRRETEDWRITGLNPPADSLKPKAQLR